MGVFIICNESQHYTPSKVLYTDQKKSKKQLNHSKLLEIAILSFKTDEQQKM